MKTHPVYENLDTSFVNLSALIRHLRSQNFNGQLNVILRGYQAKIIFNEDNPVNVEEHDKIAGRIAEGDEALQRLLIRARESGGTINVFKFVEESEPVVWKNPTAAEKPIAKPAFSQDLLPFAPVPVAVVANGNGNGNHHAPAVNDNGKPTTPAATNGNGKPTPKESFSKPLRQDFLNLVPENHSPLPLEFTNRVENRARQKQITAEDWQLLLQLVGELLGAVDNVLDNAHLNFSRMLDTARAEICDDYPFLEPSSGAFCYGDGTAEMTAQVNAKLFAASINEVLRRILERLADNPDLSEVYRDTVQKILALIHHRRPAYDKFFITPQLNRIVGV